MKKLAMAATAVALLAGSAAPANAWYYRHGYYGYRHYGYADPGAAIALGIFGLALGAVAAAQVPYYYGPPAYYPYYTAPAYSYTPGPCTRWWDGYSWNYSCP